MFFGSICVPLGKTPRLLIQLLKQETSVLVDCMTLRAHVVRAAFCCRCRNTRGFTCYGYSTMRISAMFWGCLHCIWMRWSPCHATFQVHSPFSSGAAHTVFTVSRIAPLP